MSERLTTSQVTEQKQRFEAFIKSTDLVRLGRGYYYMMVNDAQDGRYTSYCYLLRVLRQRAHVEGTCYHPDTCKQGVRSRSYRDLLEYQAVRAFTDWFGIYGDAYKEVLADLEASVNTDIRIYKGSKAYTPTQIIYHITKLTEFGQQYIADFVEGCKAINFPAPIK